MKALTLTLAAFAVAGALLVAGARAVNPCPWSNADIYTQRADGLYTLAQPGDSTVPICVRYQ